MTTLRTLFYNKYVFLLFLLPTLILAGFNIVSEDYFLRWQAIGFVWMIFIYLVFSVFRKFTPRKMPALDVDAEMMLETFTYIIVIPFAITITITLLFTILFLIFAMFLKFCSYCFYVSGLGLLYVAIYYWGIFIWMKNENIRV